MNIIAIIILIALLFDFVLNRLADYLNLTMLRDDLPRDFEGVYDPERYRRSQEYLKINTGKLAGFRSNVKLIMVNPLLQMSFPRSWKCFTGMATHLKFQKAPNF